jgi:hypothetical protein
MKMPEATAYMWQHDETGRIGFVEAWQPMDKWKESNPRLRVIGPLYDKQALIDLLEEAAKECENNFKRFRQYTGTLREHDQDMADALRKLKETL